jgi:hypothetical protein
MNPKKSCKKSYRIFWVHFLIGTNCHTFGPKRKIPQKKSLERGVGSFLRQRFFSTPKKTPNPLFKYFCRRGIEVIK